jgi:hypothetical protein
MQPLALEHANLSHGLSHVNSSSASATLVPVLQSMPCRLQTLQVLEQAQAQLSWFVCCVLQPVMQRKLFATQAHQVRVYVHPTLLCSAFGDNWQQAGFKVQLSVHKDGARVAGRRVAASKHLVLLKMHKVSSQLVHALPCS